MDKFLWRRRQLLYIGLSIAGIGTALALGSKPRSDTSRENSGSSFPTDTAVQNNTADGSAASKPLPEFQGISQWLNSAPLTVAGLKGSVVLVQFWTFGCINCQRTLPYIVRWHQQYAAQGLTVIGVHTPEFAHERDVNNIERALQQYQITYPVPLDNDFATWRAYSNQYWPHLFLADREGFLQYHHIGEGAYDTTEQTIVKLLG